MEKLLEQAKILQTTYPHIVIAGSVGLFLYGVKLKRFSNNSDIDFISPTTILNKSSSIDKELSDKSDFKGHKTVEGIKVDICVSKERSEKFNTITFNGHTYKVQTLEEILKYKTIYALKGVKKHKEDLYEMLGVPLLPETEKIETTPINNFEIY